MGRYNLQTESTFDKIKYRLNPVRRVSKRYKTGISSIDNIFGGLPMGLTVFSGESGSGKSLLARTIAKRSKNALYLFCESSKDIENASNIKWANYTTYLPKWNKAIDELSCLINEVAPDIVIIDSITEFLSCTTKAVEEADVRGGIFDIAKKTDGILPIIAISEIRSSGQYAHSAGGRAVDHSADLFVYFDKVIVDSKWLKERYGSDEEDDVVYRITVLKDKEGIAQQGKRYIIKYADGLPILRTVAETKSSVPSKSPDTDETDEGGKARWESL